ncbi:MAG: hypothetical protein GXO76_08505, partial [Calditrichaeota bacterium]|nr:hypothetical protein [Calditrichota bacterium]
MPHLSFQRIKPFLVFGLVLILLVGSTTLFAQDARVQACQQAEADAQAFTNPALWLAAGFFGGIVGVFMAYILQPNPPASKFIGKTPEYVAVYSDCYRKKVRSIRTQK